MVDLRHPPDRPVNWVCRSGNSRAEVVARTWFEARRIGSILLGSDPDATETVEVDGGEEA